MSLTLSLINDLPSGERASALWECGTFIVASDHPGGRSAFYTFADYFVKVVMKEGDFTKAMAEEQPMQTAEDARAFMNRHLTFQALAGRLELDLSRARIFNSSTSSL